jgi:hypothetical protein
MRRMSTAVFSPADARVSKSDHKLGKNKQVPWCETAQAQPPYNSPSRGKFRPDLHRKREPPVLANA